MTPITRDRYGYAAHTPLNASDPSGMIDIPGTDWCIDIADDNCESIAEQHSDGAQQIANVAGGILNGITLGNGQNTLDLTTGAGDNVQWDSGWTTVGNLTGLALDAPLAIGAGPEFLAASRWANAFSAAGACLRAGSATACGAQIGNALLWQGLTEGAGQLLGLEGGNYFGTFLDFWQIEFSNEISRYFTSGCN